MDKLGFSYERADQGSGGAAEAMGALPALLPMPSEAPSQRSERRLTRAAKRGSKEAFEALFRLHWSRVHRLSYLIVRDSSAAEDIAQESFVAALRHLDRFDSRRPLGPWLNRIVVNRSIDWTRTRRLRTEIQAAPDDYRLESGDLAVSGPEAHEAQISGGLMAALAELSADRRAVVVMRYLLDYSPSEIAEALDLPTGTVNSRLRRALDQLGASYEDDWDA
jgi:RNA polymerase sigma-70 factor (ECF subfamily)